MDDLEHIDSQWSYQMRMESIEWCGEDMGACADWIRMKIRKQERKREWHDRSVAKTRRLKALKHR